MSRDHLHRDDYPVALVALAEVLGARSHDPVGLAAIGYEPTEYGVWVDWDALGRSWLSSTETAAVTVVRGIAAAERQGGWSPRIAQLLADAIGATS